MFKTADKKFEKLGLNKILETKFFIRYERKDDIGFTQQIDIVYKNNGRHIVQSTDKDLWDEKYIGQTCVGITVPEMKLCIRKMKEKGWI